MEHTLKQQLLKLVSNEDLIFTSIKVKILASGEMVLTIGYDATSKTSENAHVINDLVARDNVFKDPGLWNFSSVETTIRLEDSVMTLRQLYAAMSLLLGSGINAPLGHSDYVDDLTAGEFFNFSNYEDNSLMSCKMGLNVPDEVVLLLVPAINDDLSHNDVVFSQQGHHLHLVMGSSYDDFITAMKHIVEVFV